MNNEVLEIKDYSLSLKIKNKFVRAVDSVDLNINKGEIVALVGESGCGKSLTALSILSLLPKSAKVINGEIKFNNMDLLKLNLSQFNKIRGNDISIIFQEPMSALNPLLKIGKQIQQVLLNHRDDVENPKEKVKDMLRQVGLSEVDIIYNSYPHQLSGGMRQRVIIAMALINSPKLLVADEPTTALDITIQAQILDLLKDMNKKKGTAVLFITHDLALVKNLCDRVYVMYASMIVESSTIENIIKNAKHPYTKALLKSLPSISQRGKKLASIKGVVPKLENRVEKGCPFAPRCEFAKEICMKEKPKLVNFEDSCVRCHFARELNK
ncbi:MAG: ABC transporter ATP-binding protein [Sphaerochaetaceae bacterium]|nr:ABC transporter ATP-binding protein [Sphaerochaetaceae bacterium]MDC7248535.1 ABC transporter ATP-binding protein [Sphaerochaetaceae bacterium]